jgi:hypothetical protein
MGSSAFEVGRRRERSRERSGMACHFGSCDGWFRRGQIQSVEIGTSQLSNLDETQTWSNSADVARTIRSPLGRSPLGRSPLGGIACENRRVSRKLVGRGVAGVACSERRWPLILAAYAPFDL